MARSWFVVALCFSCLQLLFAHGDHEHEANETPQTKTNLNVNIPNFLNILPDFDKLFGDFDFGSSSNSESDGFDRRSAQDTPIRKHLKSIRDNYQNVRSVVQSALNLKENDTDLLNLELSRKGPKTQLNINSPMGQLSLDAKARVQPKDSDNEQLGEVGGTVERVPKPFNEHMTDLIRDQVKRFDEFSLNILGPKSRDGETQNILSFSNKKDKTNVDLRTPLFPVRVSLASQGGEGFSSRSGLTPPVNKQPVDGIRDGLDDEDWDPEIEYNQHVDHQKQKYFQMRTHDLSGSESQPTPLPQQPLPKSMHHYPVDPYHHRQYYHPHGHYDDIYGMGVYPGVHVHHHSQASHPHVRPISSHPYGSEDPHHFMHRGGHFGIARQYQSPIENLPIQDYHDHRFMAPSFSQAQRKVMESYMGEIKPVENEQENYEDYIRDLEEATNSLDEDTKERLQSAFKNFKASIDNTESSDTDLEPSAEQDIDKEWLPRRIVDQRDMEMAFLNIDKDSKERPNPSDRVVVAFTLTGEPLKIYMDASVKNPVEYLHKILTDAGITLNIPVSSYDTMDTVSDILYVGAGNKGNEVSEAVALEVQNLDDIKKTISRFVAKNRTEIDTTSTQVLSEVLHDVLSAGSLKFSEALEDNFQRNPIQVLADITTFLSAAPSPETEENVEETQE